MFLWYVGAAVILAAAVAGLRQLGRRPDPDRELADLVLRAYGPEWAERFEVDEAALRDALVDGSDPALREQIEDAVSLIDIKFTRRTGGARRIGVEVLCDYPEDDEHTTVTLEIDTTLAPADVRAEFQRGESTEVFRKWSAGAGLPAGR
jgi:hypothetical protein